MNTKWIICPICQSKTRLRIRGDTELKNFPLYCPKCKQETLISVQQMNISVIIDAEPITRRFEMRLSALSFLTTYAIADRLQLRRQFYEDKAAVLLLQNWIYGDVIKSPIFRDMAVSLEVSSCPFYVNTVFQSYPSKWRSTA